MRGQWSDDYGKQQMSTPPPPISTRVSRYFTCSGRYGTRTTRRGTASLGRGDIHPLLHARRPASVLPRGPLPSRHSQGLRLNRPDPCGTAPSFSATNYLELLRIVFQRKRDISCPQFDHIYPTLIPSNPCQKKVHAVRKG